MVRISVLTMFVISFFHISSALADSSGDMMGMLESLKQQLSKMQSTIDAQNARIQQLESRRAPEISVPSSTPSEPVKMTDEDFQKSLKKNIGDAVPWLKGATYSGGLILRYDALDFSHRKSDAGSVTGANDRNRNRFLFDLWWGFEKDYGDDWKVGFDLSTGTPTDPTSGYAVEGNPGYFTFKTISVDKAYANYTPSGLKDIGPIKSVTFGGGKFSNPFSRYATTIIWFPAVTPEGAYEKINLQLLGEEKNKLNFYGTLGQLVLNENAGVNQDTNLFAYQGALTWSTNNFNTEKPVDLTAAVSYYDYPGWSQTITSNTVGVSLLKTNTILADNFRVLDIYPEVIFDVNKTTFTLFYDYAKNVGLTSSSEDPAQSLGNDIHDQDVAWGLGGRIGNPKKKGDWQLAYSYYNIGANAVVAAFDDRNFGGPAGVGLTNRKGHRFGLIYKLTDNVDVAWTGYLVRPLDPTTIVANSTNETSFRSQLDLKYKF